MTLKAENFVPPTKDDLAQDRLADLTADERAAIIEAEKEEADALKAVADGAAKTEADAAAADDAAAKAKADADAKAKADADAKAKADADAKAAADADADAKAKAAAEGKPDAAAKPDGDAEQPHAPRQAVPDWQAPADAEAKLAEIAAARDELGTKFDNGELTAKDLLAQQRKLDAQEREIERAQDRAQMATEMAQAVWFKSSVPAFLDSHTHYRDNETLYGLLDAEVRRLQIAASEAGKDPLDPAILLEADTAIRKSLEGLGVTPKPATEQADAEATEAADAANAGKQAKPRIPPTLAKLPAAEITGTDSKYASLDRLADADPLAFEDAMAKLPAAEREAYLARQ